MYIIISGYLWGILAYVFESCTLVTSLACACNFGLFSIKREEKKEEQPGKSRPSFKANQLKLQVSHLVEPDML